MELLTILLIALAGGLLPLFVKWSDRNLHTALALSTGIFLGAVFLHLLPSIALLSAEVEVHGEHTHAHGDITLWIFVLVGVLAVYLIESYLVPQHSHGSAGHDSHDHNECGDTSHDLNRHRTVGYAALAGLCIHAFTAGISLAAAEHSESIGAALFLAVCAHKGFEAFSLATVFLLAELPRKRIVLLMVLFAFVTPLGMLVGSYTLQSIGEHGVGIAAALAAGTFLYVCLCELLPEVFHRREDRSIKTILILAGITMMYFFQEAGA
ncbi:MAG: ZIP family metal transporter [Planctomycetes bacterium]|nr:ZIP family metal transporter [Planctomycetota bacterium]